MTSADENDKWRPTGMPRLVAIYAFSKLSCAGG